MKLRYIPRRPKDDTYILQLTKEQMDPILRELPGMQINPDVLLDFIKNGSQTVLVKDSKKTIGYYNYFIMDMAQPKTMHVASLILEPAYQGKKVGRTVMQHVEKEAKKLGVKRLEVFVQRNNPRSLAFTEKIGFRRSGQPWYHTFAYLKDL